MPYYTDKVLLVLAGLADPKGKFDPMFASQDDCYKQGFLDGMRSMQKLYIEVVPKSTCFNCKDNDSCEFAWDGYNTEGDCLAIK